MSLSEIRRNYSLSGLDRKELDPDPIRQFDLWMREAIVRQVHEPTAMTLATAAPDGRPSARIVLLKGVDARGFVFFTNYESRKGRELDGNPLASLVFFWPELERQVRVEGRVQRAARAESEAYFRSRPRGHRLGAWVSQQSGVVEDRTALESRLLELEARFPGDDIPMPDFWGGYRLDPDVLEFWQGRPNRLHDRLLYRRQDGLGWKILRLAP